MPHSPLCARGRLRRRVIAATAALPAVVAMFAGSGVVRASTTPAPSAVTTTAPSALIKDTGKAQPMAPISPANGPSQGPQPNFPGTGGGDAGNIPPGEPTVSAGAGYLLELVNQSLTVYTASTQSQIVHWTFAYFFNTAGIQCVDPTSAYDVLTSRFVFACTMPVTHALKISMSNTSNPAGVWCQYTLPTGNFEDFPSITVSADKVVVAGSPSGVSVSDFWTLQKSDMQACVTTTPTKDFSLYQHYRAIVQEGTSIPYEAHFVSFTDGQTEVWYVTGTPHNNNVGHTEWLAGSAPHPFTQLADVAVPGGKLGNGKMFNDVLSAVEELESSDQHRVIIIGSTQTCTGNGHLCGWLNRIDLNALQYGVQFQADVDYSSSGYDVTFPAVAMDLSGNIFTTYSYSSATNTPSAVESGFAPAGNTLFAQIIYGNTPGTTACNPNQTPPCNERWGDYLGATQDPLDTTKVWVSSLYQATTGAAGWGSVLAAARSTGVL